MNRCPLCRQQLQPHQAAMAERLEQLTERLTARCREAGELIAADGSVSESTAATLLGIASGTLRNQRSAGTAPPHLRRSRGQIRYLLIDIAAALLESN